MSCQKIKKNTTKGNTVETLYKYQAITGCSNKFKFSTVDGQMLT